MSVGLSPGRTEALATGPDAGPQTQDPPEPGVRPEQRCGGRAASPAHVPACVSSDTTPTVCLALSLRLSLPHSRNHPINTGKEAQLLLPASTFPSPTNADPRTAQSPPLSLYISLQQTFFAPRPTTAYPAALGFFLMTPKSRPAVRTEGVRYFDSANVHD